MMTHREYFAIRILGLIAKILASNSPMQREVDNIYTHICVSNRELVGKED